MEKGTSCTKQKKQKKKTSKTSDKRKLIANFVLISQQRYGDKNIHKQFNVHIHWRCFLGQQCYVHNPRMLLSFRTRDMTTNDQNANDQCGFLANLVFEWLQHKYSEAIQWMKVTGSFFFCMPLCESCICVNVCDRNRKFKRPTAQGVCDVINMQNKH